MKDDATIKTNDRKAIRMPNAAGRKRRYLYLSGKMVIQKEVSAMVSRLSINPFSKALFLALYDIFR